MSRLKRGGGPFSEADVDTLLEEFFQQEVPAALPDERAESATNGQTARHVAAPRLAAVGRDPSPRTSRLSGGLGLSVVAGSLLTIAVLISQAPAPTSDRSPADAANSGAGGNERTLVEGKDAADAPDGVERYIPADGPVELRSKSRIKRVTVIDPETGEEVEVPLPELEIEIFPLENDER